MASDTIIIATNVTLSDILLEDLGKSIDATTAIELTELFDVTELIESKDLAHYVEIGDITLNNGLVDLDTDEALNHLHFDTRLEDDQTIDQATNIAVLDSSNVLRIDVLQDETPIVEYTKQLNFTGGVDVTDDGDGRATIDIQGGGTSATDKKAGIIALALDDTNKDILFDSSFEDTDYSISISIIKY